MDEDKREVIERMEDIGGELNHSHGLTPESSWEDIQDFILGQVHELEDVAPSTHLVDEEMEARAT
jgi:hypothetical protein